MVVGQTKTTTLAMVDVELWSPESGTKFQRNVAYSYFLCWLWSEVWLSARPTTVTQFSSACLDTCWTGCNRSWMPPRGWYFWRGNPTTSIHCSASYTGCEFQIVPGFGSALRHTTAWTTRRHLTWLTVYAKPLMLMLVIVVCNLLTCRHCSYHQFVDQHWVTVHSQ